MKGIKCFNCGKIIKENDNFLSPDGEIAFCSNGCWFESDGDSLVTAEVGYFGFDPKSLPWVELSEDEGE